MNGHETPEPPEPLVLTAMTLEERQTAEFLAAGLGQLRAARPGFQDELERRLLAQLEVPVRPWWRAWVPSRAQAGRQAVGLRQTGRRAAGLRRLPRRSMFGLAAASAVALMAASVSLPLLGTSDASAREILEKAQANVENPILSGVKSFHLKSKIWTDHRPIGRSEGPHESLTEQWFLSPDHMRTETRSTGKDGKPVLSGLMVNGSEAKHYSTDGAEDVAMVGVFAIPASPSGEKPPEGALVTSGLKPAGPPPDGAVTRSAGTTVSAGTAVKPSASGTVTTATPPGGPGQPASAGVATGPAPSEGHMLGVRVAVYQRQDGDNHEPGDEQAQAIVFGENCPEPKRTGEGTVAGRAVFVIEDDLTSCLPANAPDDMAGRHMRWVDQKTFLPLKMEMYGRNGSLVERYEVTTIEYDIDIPAKTFTELPAGTSLRDPKLLPAIEVRKP